MDPAQELVDVVDELDRVLGAVPRAEMRAKGLLHRSTSILVRRPAGEIYVHRRTGTKDVHPGMYDMFVGGVVGAGETYDEAAGRELEEETGIAGVELRPLFRHLYRGGSTPCWTAVYRVEWDGQVRAQAEEIDWGGFVTAEELDRMLGEREFCPDSREIYELMRRDRLVP